MSQDRQLQGHQIILVHPVLRRLPHERALAPTRTAVPENGTTAGADDVVQVGELDDEGVPVVFVEGAFFEVLVYEAFFERGGGLFLEREGDMKSLVKEEC